MSNVSQQVSDRLGRGLFVGIDYADGVVQLCAMDAAGRVLVNRPCANDWRALSGAVAGKGVVRRAAIEACSGAADLAEELIEHAGWHMELGHPHYVAKLKGSPDKHDFGDAQLVADLTRVGYLPRTWLPPAYIRQLRQLVGYRQQLVDQRRAAKLRVGAILREYRVVFPQRLIKSRWSRAWVSFARCTMALNEHAQWIVKQLLDQVQELDKRVASAEQRLRQATVDDAMVDRLMNYQGVGEITAWVIRAFIGRFDRFNTGKQLSRYCGLSPRNVSSGGKQSDGGLIKASNKILRATAIQAAHRLIRTEPRWRTMAEQMRRRGKPPCVIAAAVANRWIRRMHYDLRGIEQQQQKEKTKTARTAEYRGQVCGSPPEDTAAANGRCLLGPTTKRR